VREEQSALGSMDYVYEWITINIMGEWIERVEGREERERES